MDDQNQTPVQPVADPMGAPSSGTCWTCSTGCRTNTSANAGTDSPEPVVPAEPVMPEPAPVAPVQPDRNPVV